MGVVVMRYIGFFILLIPTPLVSVLFAAARVLPRKKIYEWRKLIHVTPPGPTLIVKKLVILAITQVKRGVAWRGTANLDLHVAKWSGAGASERMEHRQ